MALQNYRVYIALSLVAIGLQVFTTAAEARLYTGVVTHVTDGDTFWVRTSARGGLELPLPPQPRPLCN